MRMVFNNKYELKAPLTARELEGSRETMGSNLHSSFIVLMGTWIEVQTRRWRDN